jgi:hypothetical protein
MRRLLWPVPLLVVLAGSPALATEPPSKPEASNEFVMLGLGIFMNHAICQYPGADNPKACGWLSEAGMGGLGLACAFI